MKVPTKTTKQRNEHMNSGLSVFIVLSLILFGTSCGIDGSAASETSNDSVLSVTPASDTPTSEGASTAVFFPQQAPPTGEQSFPAAELIGKLLVRDGCVRVAREGGSEYLAIWPSGVDLNTDDTITIVDDAGQVVATVGQEISVGGGEVPLSIAAAYSPTMRQPSIPCEGPYWLVSNIGQSVP